MGGRVATAVVTMLALTAIEKATQKGAAQGDEAKPQHQQ